MATLDETLLVTHDRPASDEYAAGAASWPMWDSTTHEDGSGRFHFAYVFHIPSRRRVAPAGAGGEGATDVARRIASQPATMPSDT